MSRTNASLAVASAAVLLLLAALVATGADAKNGVRTPDAARIPEHIRRFVTAQDERTSPVTGGQKYFGTILGGNQMNNTFAAGAELRVLVAASYMTNVTRNVIRAEGRIRDGRIGLPDQYRADHGQLLSKLLGTGNYTLLPAFNISGPSPTRVRVIAAYASRASSGSLVSCTSASQDTWAEYWTMSPRNLAFGRQMVYSGFVTFTAPPFPFRICVKDTRNLNTTKAGRKLDGGVNANWQEFENLKGTRFNFHEPVLLWKTPQATSTLEDGDYAAIEILGSDPMRSLLARLNGNVGPLNSGFYKMANVSAFTLIDSVKLVPFGFPCTYEKEESRTYFNLATSTTSRQQYCGANMVQAVTGEWINTYCEREGSVANGVARVGARTINPFAATMNLPATWSNKKTERESLIAYLKLAQGNYDVCVSQKTWRRAAFQMSAMSRHQYGGYARNAMPVWMKAYSAESSACDRLRGYDGVSNQRHVDSCAPRRTALVVGAATGATTWATTDDTPGTWGEIKFTGTGLNYNAASQWDFASTADYYNLTNGDQFRLVPEFYFSDAQTATASNAAGTVTVQQSRTLAGAVTTMSVTRASATYVASNLNTASVGTYRQYAPVTPSVGTQAAIGAGSGCFWQGNDNYGATGHFGNPGTTCCSSPPCSTTGWCAKTDTDDAGPTASADLGGDPRIGYSAWERDGSSATNAWAYIRFPTAGTYRVCYKKAGTSSWRVLRGTSSVHATSNVTFSVRKLNRGYTYHFNDTRALTWGPVTIRSLAGNTLDKRAWTYYTTTTTPVIGSALKIVTTTQSCYVSAAQSRTYTMNPGSLEAVNGLGSADDSATATSTIYFYVRVPAYTTGATYYRICFRNGGENWHALSDPSFRSHMYFTTSNKFGPWPASTMTYTLVDTQIGSWGKFIFNRSDTPTPALNADIMRGDRFRIVQNVTSGQVDVGCDVVYDPTGTTITDERYRAQRFDATMMDDNLGVACAVDSGTTTATCFTGNTKPTSNGVVATTPYTNLVWDSEWNQLTNLDGTAGFIRLPTGLSAANRPVGYKVCYQQARFQNWIEVAGASRSSILTVTRARTVTAAAATTTVWSGAYTYIQLTATSNGFPVRIRYDLVKLVPFAQTCEAPVATNAGYELYTAISGVSTSNCIVDGSNSTIIGTSCQTDIWSQNARAYMTMPTVRGAGGALSSYRICYMARSSSTEATQNWHDLSGTSPFVVRNHGITYTVSSKPYVEGVFSVRITSSDYLLDTRASQDNAKIILANFPCTFNSGTQPSTNAGYQHVGTEIPSTTTGWTDLLPGDDYPTREARIDVVLSSTSSHKVCYKPATATEWFEVLQATGSQRMYALATDYITPATGEISKFTVNSAITGQSASGSLTTYGGVIAYTAAAIAGAATYDLTTYNFKIVYNTAPTASQTHKLKFVMQYIDSAPGAYSLVAGTSCLSAGETHDFTTTATTTQNIAINLPVTPARYLVCVWSSATGAWYQAPRDAVANTVLQPMHVIPSELAFTVTAGATTGTGTVTIQDTFSTTTANYGGLAGVDYVYFVNVTAGKGAACGTTADFQNVARDTARMNLTSTVFGIDNTKFLGVRSTLSMAIPATPARSGAYLVCVFRSQASSTNTTGVAPFVRSGWYQVPLASTTAAKVPAYVLTGATKLNVTTCPNFNMTYKLRTGRTFDVTVRAEDASSNLIEYTTGTPRYGVTAVGTGYALQSFDGECSSTSAPTYGYTTGALTQFMSAGTVKYSLTALSACPAGGCTLSFASSNGLASSQTCTFDVIPTTIAQVRWAVTPTQCVMGEWCSFRAVAVHSDGGVAHTINSGVTFTVAGWTMTTADAQTTSGSNFNIAGGSSGFTNGVVDFRVRFRPNGYSALASETVTLVASANGKTSPVASFVVQRPVLSAIHVVDVYPIETAGAPILPLQPTWEPTGTTFRGGDALQLGSSAVTAAAGYHLVAGQAYVVTLRAVVTINSGTMYAAYDQVVPAGFGVSINNAFVTSLASQAVPNAVLTASASTTESDVTPFGTVSWSQGATSLDVRLRFRNSNGCGAGCTIPFAFTGSALTASITTPVRGIASTLKVTGCATTLAGLATSSAATCTGVTSTVNQGWYINVSAVDEFGLVDTFFDGDLLAVLDEESQDLAAALGVKLTTVAELTAGTTPKDYVKVTMSRGFGTLAGVSFTKPCPANTCELQLMSTWGAGAISAGYLVATPNTVRLKAELNTVLAYCTSEVSGECSSVAGVSAFNVTNAQALIYKDTRVCFNVWAVDSLGRSTLYETNWIGYFVRDTGASPQSLTVTDDRSNTNFALRYKPLVRSATSFCFTVSGMTSPRPIEVHFIAQRFGTAATYWSHGATGKQVVGPLKVWPKKIVAAVLLAGATNGDVVTGSSSGVVSAAFTGSTLNLGLTFVLKDHYNNSIVSSEVNTADQSKYLWLRTQGEARGATVYNSGSTLLRGDANVSLAAGATVNVTSSTLQATIAVTAACLGCRVTFELVDQAGVVSGTRSLSNVVEFAGTNVTLFVVNQDATAVRRLAFNPSTSPWTSYWVNGTATSATSNTAPTYHVASCFGQMSCAPKLASTNLANCDARGTSTKIGSSASTGLLMRVYVMPTTTALNSVFEPQDSKSQVDIMNTYTVTVSFGNQVMRCESTGLACTAGDYTTTPMQTLTAYGVTVRDAIGQFYLVSDGAIRTTNFHLSGQNTAAYLIDNTTLGGLDVAPSVGGAFSATATAASGSITVSPLSMRAAGNAFYWRPTAEPRRLAVYTSAQNADPCNDTLRYACTGGTGCSTAGLAEQGSVQTGLAHSYASFTYPTGLAFPMTVEVFDANGVRVNGAAGTMRAEVASWLGCNNGGLPVFTTPVIAGRATMWLNFATPCEACRIKFTLIPDGSQSALYATMNAQPALLSVLASSTVTVRGTTTAASQLVVTAASPASALTSSTTSLTVATPVELTLLPRAVVGRIPFATTASTVRVAIYPQVQTSGSNWWWVGNGGVLRTSLTGTSNAHYQSYLPAVTSTTTTSVYFTRTCASCRLIVAYAIDSNAATSFTLPSTFVVTTAASTLTLVGFTPRTLRVNQDTAVALWSTGSENAAIAVAGVAPATTVGVAPTPSFNVLNNSNGDGGKLTATSWVFNNVQVHRLSLSGPCDTCQVAVGANLFRVRILTTATHLRPGADAPALTPQQLAMGADRPALLVPLQQWRVVPVMALDDAGFVDQAAGVRGCEFPASRFMCVDTPIAVVPSVSANGMSAGGFPVTATDFIMSPTNGVATQNTQMYFGRVNYNMSFTLPHREAIAIFSATLPAPAGAVSSALTATRSFPVPKYSVSVGTTGLELKVVTGATSLTQNVENVFHVALVGTHSSSATARYVAVLATNAVVLTASAGCPAYTYNTSSSALVAGYMTFSVKFSAATTATATCTLTWQAASGSGSCATTAACMASQAVTVTAVTVSRFTFARPTVDDNGVGSTARPMYAHAGRTMKVRTNVWGTGAVVGALYPVTTCTSCQLTVSTTDCNFADQTATVAAGMSSAEVSLPFAERTGVASYTCTITVTMSQAGSLGGASLIAGPDGVTTTNTYTVTVCKSAAVRMLTNTSSMYRGVTLKTGVAYEFYAVMVDSTGAQCRGDSQDDATVLTIAAVHGATGAVIPNLVAINTNATSTTTAAFAAGNMAALARTSVTAVGGAFKFAVVFTNSTAVLGLTAGVKLRVTASGSLTTSVATSGAVWTMIAGARLKWGMGTIPAWLVRNRVIETGMRVGETGLSVIAVDAIPDAWYETGLIRGMPNRAQGPSEYGNDADIFWRVMPTPPATSAFPLAFTGGAATTRLAMGMAAWTSAQWNGDDGLYGLSVATPAPWAIMPTPTVAVTTQTVSQIRLDTRGYTSTAAASCTSNCELINGTFTRRVNATVSPSPFWEVESLTSFTMSVMLTDAAGMPVRGDNNSVIAVTLNSNVNTTVVLGTPPQFAMRGVQYARVSQGVATFTLGFIGSTALGASDAVATLAFSCAAMRPAPLLRMGESSANPCTLTSTVVTQPIKVVDVALAAAAHQNVQNRLIVKARLGLPRYTLLNVSLFLDKLTPALVTRGVSWLTRADLAKVLRPTRCTVNTLFPADGDLGTTVCQNGVCDGSNTNCPTGINACGCPGSTVRSLLLSRFLLQNTSANTTTAVEVAYELWRSDAFPAKTTAQISAEYDKIQLATIDALRTDADLLNGFQVQSVSVRGFNVVVTPIPAPTTPPTPGPSNNGNSTLPPPQPPVTDAASPLALLAAVLMAALLALFA